MTTKCVELLENLISNFENTSAWEIKSIETTIPTTAKEIKNDYFEKEYFEEIELEDGDEDWNYANVYLPLDGLYIKVWVQY